MNKMTLKIREIKMVIFLEERNFHLVLIIEIHKLLNIIKAIQKLVLLKILKNDFIINHFYINNL
jgi:hypothetical protein